MVARPASPPHQLEASQVQSYRMPFTVNRQFKPHPRLLGLRPLPPDGTPARLRVRGAADCGYARRPRPHVLHQLRIGVRRHRAQDRFRLSPAPRRGHAPLADRPRARPIRCRLRRHAGRRDRPDPPGLRHGLGSRSARHATSCIPRGREGQGMRLFSYGFNCRRALQEELGRQRRAVPSENSAPGCLSSWESVRRRARISSDLARWHPALIAVAVSCVSPFDHDRSPSDSCQPISASTA